MSKRSTSLNAARNKAARTPRPESAKARSRRPSAEATRKRLLETGRKAFARRGLTGTNLKQDILEPAGVAVGSFYHQFPNKTDLLLAILEEDLHDLQTVLQRAQEPRAGRSLFDIARASYTATFDLVERHPDTMRILFRESAVDDPQVQSFARREHKRWIKILTHNFQRLTATDPQAPHIELAAELISVLTNGAIAHYLGLPEQERVAARERLIDGLVRLTVGGVPALGVDEAALAHPLSLIPSHGPADPKEDGQT
ncbi:MAG: TetR/AcrR family transcriptional regulator [Deltaproteobacteria bacterium]|nr:TetR/AcrR family transcriptional regulator [Deltaproteobacteria bacterium]MBW2396317.1 TetR/AcrR family transcriptional regulator [Deltaproteobacteria bacterium]